MHTGAFWWTIYWLSTPALAVLGGLLLWRKLPGKFPFFFTYVVVAFWDEIARQITYRIGGSVYRNTYWIAHLVDALFIFLATYELFIRRLFPAFHKLKFYRYLFSITALVIIGLAIPIVLGGIKIDALSIVIRIVDFARVAVLVFFVGLMTFMGRQWGRYEFGIALGLSVDAAAFLIVFALYVKSGQPLQGMVRELPVFGKDAAVLIWVISFLRAEKSTPALTIPAGMVEESKGWQETLKGSFGRKRSD